MSDSRSRQDRFVGLALFLGGAGLLYAVATNAHLLDRASEIASYAWYFVSGLVLVTASFLFAAGKQESRTMRVLVYTFIALTLPLLILTLVLS